MKSNVKIKSRNAELSAVLSETGSEDIAVCSHGFTSKKDATRFLEIEAKLNTMGISTIRFDFSGCGESGDAEISVENEIEDLKAVIDFVLTRGYRRLILIGHSLGGLVNFKIYPFYKNKIKAIVGIAPVTHKSDSSWKNKYEKRFEDKGTYYLFKRIIDNVEKQFKISKKYFQEREDVDQEKLLSGIECPVLIIHGTEDRSIPLWHSEEAIKVLKNGELRIMEGADHKFTGREEEVALLIKEWLSSLYHKKH